MNPIKSTFVPSDHGRSSLVPTILVVDDEPAILDLLVSVLTEEGYLVLTAADGRLALEIARSTPLALILTDYMMPRMNGIELSHQLRADAQTATIPIILMSAVPPVELSPITTLIRKPFDIDTLINQIRHHQQPPEARQGLT